MVKFNVKNNMQIHLKVIECNKIHHHNSTDAVFRPFYTTGTLECCPMFVYKKLLLNEQKKYHLNFYTILLTYCLIIYQVQRDYAIQHSANNCLLSIN